ncbi:retrovirus-related Pol polyprotein from transposon opus [Trichonephila clavipes]|nr:retrovirus-related Pol polyprotein from transposon opus [Trichonephila clavipes]
MATTALPRNSRRLFIRDRRTNVTFLIDTGSDVSIIPATKTQRQNNSQMTLSAANTSPHTRNSRIHSIKTVSGDSVYHELLRKFPDITKPPRPDQEIKHSVVHYIETNSRPVTAKARRLAPDRLRIAKAEFENMITLGHMRPSKRTPGNVYFGQTFSSHARRKRLHNLHRPEASHVCLFMQNPDKCSPRQWRHLDFISQFSTDVRHINGTRNAVADALSRIEVNQISNSFLDFEALSKAQLEGNEYKVSKMTRNLPLVFKRVPSPVSATELICDTSTGSPRPFVPYNFRRTIFEHFHNLAHPGVAASFQLIASRYVWPNMRKTVKDWVQNCIGCQRSKVHRHTKTPLGTFSPYLMQDFHTFMWI